MDINKIIMDALHETDTNMKEAVQESVKQELDNVSLETPLSETLLMAALPSAISAGIGAMSLRKTLKNTNTLNEMDWDEIAKKAGEHVDTAKEAVKTGAKWLAKKADEGYEGLKKVPGKIANYISDKKAQWDARDSNITGTVKKGIKNLGKTKSLDDAVDKAKYAGKVAKHFVNNQLEKVGNITTKGEEAFAKVVKKITK